jgi:hypothetical protein
MRYLEQFNFKGQNICYLRIAELLKANPTIQALVGESWFYDPKLKEISPRLNYLGRYPEENGAKIFRIITSESDIRLSTLKSKTRKRLFGEGKYKPCHHMLVWPRKQLINWAEEQNKKFELKISKKQQESKIIELKEALCHIEPEFFRMYPIELYIEEIKSYDRLIQYRYISPKLEKILRKIRDEYNNKAFYLYHKLAICTFIHLSIDEIKNRRLPDSVLSLKEFLGQ